jgi:hypothetical protein
MADPRPTLPKLGPPLERLLRAASIVVLGVATLATVGSLLLTIRTRVLDYAEGEVLFDASRIRDGLPLYVDLRTGALDYGPVPSRHFVVYVPTFAWALSFLPARLAAPLGRLASGAAWAGALAFIVGRARRECRRVALVGAVFLLGAYTLTSYATLARPDGVAVAIAGVAMAESVRRGGVGFWRGAALALAAWTKPNVLGSLAGAMGAELAVHRRRALWAVLGLSAVTIPVVVLLEHVSRGAWMAHLIGSTKAPLLWSLLRGAMISRLPFFGAPVALAWVASWRGVRLCRTGSWHALAGSVTAFAWGLATQAKVGCASNYWMEPTLVALAALAHMPQPALARGRRIASAALGLLQVLWVDLASWNSARENYVEARDQSALLMRVRESCSGLVLADSPGLEMELDGRLLTSPLQLRYLVKSGGLPAERWVEVVRQRQVVCALTYSPIDGPLPAGEREATVPEVVQALSSKFVLIEHAAGLWFYKARDGA